MKYQIIIRAGAIKFFGEVKRAYPTMKDIQSTLSEFERQFNLAHIKPDDDGTLMKVIIEEV